MIAINGMESSQVGFLLSGPSSELRRLPVSNKVPKEPKEEDRRKTDKPRRRLGDPKPGAV